jgi:hypothetical protein
MGASRWHLYIVRLSLSIYTLAAIRWVDKGVAWVPEFRQISAGPFEFRGFVCFVAFGMINFLQNPMDSYTAVCRRQSQHKVCLRFSKSEWPRIHGWHHTPKYLTPALIQYHPAAQSDGSKTNCCIISAFLILDTDLRICLELQWFDLLIIIHWDDLSYERQRNVKLSVSVSMLFNN